MTVRRALLLILGFVAILAPTRLVTSRLVPDPESPFEPSLPLWVGLVVSSVLAAVLVVWLGSVTVHGSWRALGWHLDAPLRQLGLGLLGGVVAVGVVVVMALGAGVTAPDLVEALSSMNLAQRLVFVGIGLQAGFVEESLFRGNLQPLLEQRVGRWRGLLLTALVFSAYHLDPRPFSFVGKFVYGLIYGALRQRGGSLVAPALAHLLVWIIAGSL